MCSLPPFNLPTPSSPMKTMGYWERSFKFPAACLGRSNVHIAVPGDTIVDLAKDYDIDLTCLEAGNPQIADPKYVPSRRLYPNSYHLFPVKHWCTLGLENLCRAYVDLNAARSTEKSCPITITASGGVEGIAGQLDDEQIRVNGSYPLQALPSTAERL